MTEDNKKNNQRFILITVSGTLLLTAPLLKSGWQIIDGLRGISLLLYILVIWCMLILFIYFNVQQRK